MSLGVAIGTVAVLGVALIVRAVKVLREEQLLLSSERMVEAANKMAPTPPAEVGDACGKQ